MDELMSIGEFSKRSGLSAKRLRSYASAGLLIPAAIDASSGYRYYAAHQVSRARLIDLLRRAEAPVAQIGSFLRNPTSKQLDLWERELTQDVERRQQAIASARNMLAMELEGKDIEKSLLTGGDPMEMMMAARSDIGRVRSHNEDAVLTSETLAAVADGLGGNGAGEVAAQTAMAVFAAAFTGKSIDELGAGVRAANAAVWHRARATKDLEGMGTTICAAALVDGQQLVVVNVGDSRAYLIRGGSISQITEDHSVVAGLVKRGEISEGDILDHPQRSVLTRALGAGPEVDADTEQFDAQSGDRLILCTDGLVNELSEGEITELGTGKGDPQQVADALVTQAVSNGGRDNVSVVIVDIAG